MKTSSMLSDLGLKMGETRKKKLTENMSENRAASTFKTEVGGGRRRSANRGSAAVAVLDTAKLKNGVYGENSD